MSKDLKFHALIEALRIIHGTTNTVIEALEKYEDTKNIGDDEIKVIDSWIRKTDPDEDKSRKVARCLVWYIAKIKLGIPEIESAKFPYCECP